MATTNWLSPSTNLTDAGWTGQANVYAQDGVNATRTVVGGAETPYFRVYGFNDAGTPLATLLSGATAILGIEVQFYGNASGAIDYDYVVLGNAPAGSPQGLTTKNIGLPLVTSAYTATIGGPADLWGGKTGGPFAVADFDSNMGLSGAWSSTTSRVITWDHVRMRITYTAAAGGAGGKWWWGNLSS